MVVLDRGKSLIVSTASNFFGVPLKNADANQLQVLERFLDQPACRTLCAQPEKTQNEDISLRLSNDLPAGKNILVFFKVSPREVTDDNFHDVVQVTSIGDGEGSTLIEALRQVWAPALQYSGLNSVVLKKFEEDLLGPRPPSCVADEEALWLRKRDESRKSDERTRCQEAANILRNIRLELENAAAARDGLISVDEAMETTSGFVDDLWKLDERAFNEDRMKRLLDVIGDEVSTIVKILIDQPTQELELRSKEEAISMGADVCEKWVNVCERLTKLFWPHHSLHRWKGPIFVPSRCSKFANQLREIADMRAQYRQLLKLLTPNEIFSLDTDKLLQKLDRIEDVVGNDERDKEWSRLKQQIENDLQPAEELVAQSLKQQIANADTPNAMLSEFSKYSELIKRDGLKRALQSERETLLTTLDTLIDSYTSDWDISNVLDIPKILQEVQATRTAETNLDNLKKIAKLLLSDLPNYSETSLKINNALSEIGRKKQELIESWINDTKNAIARKELTLSTDSPVVELNGASLMRVNYDPRLIALINDARALSGLGVELPREIRDLVTRAEELSGRARALQQVATFHNTIGDRMVPSQRPLMLAMALQLARAVQEQSGIVWSDTRAVDAYTTRLRELVRKFARQNVELAAKHNALRDLVSNLLRGDAINLVGNQSVWKETLTGMRTIVDTVEAEYGNTKAWKLHWDRQLLKSLGVAYRAALPSLLKKLPEMRVELTFRDGVVQWRPPLEEIRAKLYSSIRRFLALPINFRGVGDQADARFADLVEKNAYLFGGVYKEAELVLSAIETFRLKWLALAAPAKIDPGESLKGKPPQDWIRQFKDAKQWAQDVGRLRGSEVKIWCITVETATIRTDLELASRRYWERLSSDLRAEASSRLVAVLDFLSSASKELEKRPHTVAEVGQASETQERIQRQISGISEEMEVIVGLSKVLAAWTSEILDGVNAAYANWENLTTRLDRHKAVLAHQLEDAKVNLRHRGVALRDERERWEGKWSSKPEIVTLEWIDSMRDRWTTLINEREALDGDCKKVGLNVNEVLGEEDDTLLVELQRQLEAEESNCRFQGEFLEELRRQEAEEWTVARRRLPRFQDWLDSWETRIRTKFAVGEKNESEHDERKTKPEVDTFVGKKLTEIRSSIEWIQLLRGDELAEEHWTELRSILTLDGEIKNLRDITLGHLLNNTDKIKSNIDRIKDITKRAAAESGIRQALLELEAWESTTSLKLLESKDSKNTAIMLVDEYGGLLARSGELRLLLEGAKGASGYERFASRASRCEAALSELEERIKILSMVQRKWIYLEPVYGGGAAPNDSGRWIKADKEFRYLMGEISRDPRVPSLRRLPLPALTNLKDLLDKCQRCLDEFLEEKRSAYPRLYFLNDEDLLELISGSGRGLDTHLPKLYQGLGSVVKENNAITSIISPEGEVLKLLAPIDLSLSLPIWLGNLEDEIRNTLRKNLEKCLSESTPDPSIYPTQILLLSERIHFTERCSQALKEGRSSLKNLVEYLETQRARYRGLEDAGDKLTALKARALLLETVHYLEVARDLLAMTNSGGNTFWMWYRQLRSYKTAKGPIIRCAGAEFPYRFEYQGAAGGLVRTPLTERCFLALTQAMKLGLGGSPTGPAGTGKTESIKALGAILGRLVLVFNCDEGMDTGSMKRILGGLAQAGAWGCFDEFNRLEEETLSAVGMLIRPLQEAIRDNASQVFFGDQKVDLDPHCCIFITMNPAGSEYGGRHKLPDSLARLFRPIGMVHPDRTDIVKALLECAGFLEATTLAKQLVEVVNISEILLSSQPQYDWGLRALRSVLNVLPANLNVDETTKLVIAIRTSILPKLTDEDTSKFLALLNDVFPKIDISNCVSTEKQSLQNTLLNLCTVQGYSEAIANRCFQLSEQLKSRTGVVIVGPPGSGKTLIRKLLAEGMSKIGESIIQYTLYPGAMPKSRLLGRVDPQTREWKEGLLSSAVATAGQMPTWIIFNGDVEPEWAEALNSALDDNRLLTLPNGVGIKLNANTKFIFETHKLTEASPATVSRLGVIHLGTTDSTSLLTPAKLNTMPSIIRDVAKLNLCSCVNEVLKISDDHSSSHGLMESTLCHLRNATSKTLVTHGLLVALCGQIESPKAREQLARSIYQLTDCWCPNPEKPFDVVYDQDNDRLEPFTNELLSTETENGPVLFSGPLKRAMAAISPWIRNNYPVIIRGPSGSGKNTLISVVLSIMKNNELSNSESSSILKGSSLHGPQDLISRLKRACVRLDSSSNGRIYKPKNGSRIILIMNDVHLATKDLQELLRELLQEGGFHEEDLEFAKIPLSMVCTADPSTRLHPRLEALLATHYMPHSSSNDTIAILELHLRKSLCRREVSTESWISRAASIMHESLNTVSTKDMIYSWTLKDLVFWANSLQYYPTPENETDVTCYLFDAGQILFGPRMTIRDRNRWESILQSKLSDAKNSSNDVYIWKSGATSLLQLSSEKWKNEIMNVSARCTREGEPIQAIISAQLLQIVAGLSWALGVNLRGIILPGRPGAGRKSATKLAATYTSHRVIDSGPGRGRSSIKVAVQSAGIDGERSLLLLEEHHIREEGLPSLVSAIVSRGELPGLFTTEELDGLVAPLADLARQEDFPGTLEQYLYHRLRQYLRVVIVMDVSEIRELWVQRSGMMKHCAIVCPSPGSEWWLTESGLNEIANQRLKIDPDRDDSGIKTMLQSHLQAPRSQQAPARFLALLHVQNHLRESWNQELEAKLKSLEAGISRLKEAGEQIAQLEEQASKQRQELEIEKGKANAALEQITATMRGATGQRGEMTNLKAETERESAELARRKADIESELGKVEPLVEQAAQAVAGISADALAEVRSLRAPPAPVRDVLEGVLRLMGIKDTSWNSMKTFLAKRGIKDEIRTWDARRSTPASLDAVAKLIKERPESFDEKTAKRASVAAAPLAAWVLANLQYGEIVQQVAPLEREQRLLAERLSAAEAQLGKLAAGLNTVESRVAQLQEQLAAHSRGAAALQLRTEATESSLATARALLQKLDSEHGDWQTQLQELTSRRAKLDIEAANVASLLVYQDPLREDDWKKAAIELLVTERDRLIWRAQGLPADTGSFIGAACVLKGPIVPILIDPSGVAVSWLKSNIGSKLEIGNPSDQKFLTTLELAVRFGKPLLIEELLDFPDVLLPLLRQRPLRLGDRALQPQNGFRLYLATRRDKLDFGVPREADALLFKVSLGAGSRSLAERFIERVLLKETPELEIQRREALEREEKLAGERDEARLELLHQLGRARGQDLLQESNENQSGGLLASLEATQAKAKEIAAVLDESRRNFESVTRRAKSHEKLAKFAANLYKAIRALTSLSCLYVFSSDAFTDIFLQAVSSKIDVEDKKEQERLAEKKLIALTLQHCSKAAYRKHRLPIALHLALCLHPVPEIERNILLDVSGSSQDENSDSGIPDWIPEERQPAAKLLTTFLPQVAEKLRPSWLENVMDIYTERNLSAFQKVIIVKTLRPDHLYTALTRLAAEKLGVRDLAPSPWTLKNIAEEETVRPILLLLSPGADPATELETLLSNQTVPASGFVEVSLGQGQVIQAEHALDAACRNGGWILLSNLQLALNWLPRLESLLRSSICTTDRHVNTRIWLTTEECSGFDSGLAGLCLKLAYEPPEGVKRNTRRSLQQLQARSYLRRMKSSSETVGGTFLLAWLHATLQERRRFVPQGWIKAYEWNEADLNAACELVLKEMTKMSISAVDRNSSRSEGTTDWEAARGLLDVAAYGGRLQDDYDARALRSIIREIWSKDILEGRRSLGGTLNVPLAIPVTANDDLAKTLDRLGDEDSPREYFGLPSNANRAWERVAAETALLLLSGITTKSSTSDEKTQKRSQHKVQADLLDLIRRKSSTFVNGKVKIEKADSTPLGCFFVDEISLTRNLLNTIQTDIETSHFKDSKTPKKWLNRWANGPKGVVKYVESLLTRYQELQSMLSQVPVRRVDLSRLARPRAFLAALKQHVARESGNPLEALRLRVDWAGDRSKDPSDRYSVMLDGLLISGALIEKGRLVDVDVDAPPVTAAPNCCVAYDVAECAEDPENQEGTNITVPVYVNSQRDELLFALPVNCERESQDVWMRRGVALHLRSV